MDLRKVGNENLYTVVRLRLSLSMFSLGVTYAGASCVMRLDPPRPVLLDCFDSSDTGVLIVETDVGNEQ